MKILKCICKKTSATACKFTKRGLCHGCCLGKFLRLSGQITLQFWPKSLSNKEKTNFPLRVHRRKIVLKCLLPFATSVREDHYSFLVTIKRKHCCLDLLFINPFWPNVSFLYLLKTSESFLFSDIFRGYRNRPLG